MITRLIVLVLVLGAAWFAVALAERRRGATSVGIADGLTIVTGEDCHLCPLAVAAAEAAGVTPRVVDVADLPGHGIRSLPTAFVTDAAGTVLVRRSGRSVIADMAVLAEMVRVAA